LDLGVEIVRLFAVAAGIAS